MEYRYEEVLEFVEKIKNILIFIPNFEDKNYCEDYLKYSIEVCEEWLENNKEKYIKEKRINEFFENLEFDKERKC